MTFANLPVIRPVRMGGCGVFAALALGTLALFGCGRGASQPANQPPVPSYLANEPAPSDLEQRAEAESLQLLNRLRAEKGLAPLQLDAHLSLIARAHSRDMRESGFFGHDSPTTGGAQDRVDKAGYQALETRENVALGPDAAKAHEKLAQSPGHFANMVASTVTHVGIGAVRDNPVAGQVQGYYFTQLFATPVPVLTNDQARAVVVERVNEYWAKHGLKRLEPHAVLQQAAERHIGEVDGENPGKNLKNIGQNVLKTVSTGGSLDRLGAKSVQTGAQAGASAQLLRPETMLDRQVKAYGFAIDQHRDSTGKTLVKLLFIVAR